ncbi:MAG: hypothetical protein MUE41_13575, partial [Gemmatimonadaceae bacterium]|nr:hypothetical protein [Gemmatimonadaceae bacterium]
RAAIPELDEHQVNIFSPEDLAVVGGRRAAAIVRALDLSAFTDIVVDLSALSVGTSFPLVRALLEAADNGTFNLHAVVVADAGLDASITPLPGDAVIDLHGFRGELGLESRRDAALLWLPQLAFGRREMLARVHADLSPHDICPILPFPAHDPRLGDALVEEYLELLTDTWAVDPRNFIYAAEEDPLDVYRTILELDDARRPVFEGDGGGSLLVLSPVGSKVLALGALMAAAERDFPVRHIEAVGFEVDLNRLQKYDDTQGTFAHVWLAGAPYQATADNSIAAPRSTGAP